MRPAIGWFRSRVRRRDRSTTAGSAVPCTQTAASRADQTDRKSVAIASAATSVQRARCRRTKSTMRSLCNSHARRTREGSAQNGACARRSALSTTSHTDRYTSTNRRPGCCAHWSRNNEARGSLATHRSRAADRPAQNCCTVAVASPSRDGSSGPPDDTPQSRCPSPSGSERWNQSRWMATNEESSRYCSVSLASTCSPGCQPPSTSRRVISDVPDLCMPATITPFTSARLTPGPAGVRSTNDGAATPAAPPSAASRCG